MRLINTDTLKSMIEERQRLPGKSRSEVYGDDRIRWDVWDYVLDLIEGMESWISVKDRVPEDPNEAVLVIVNSEDGFLQNAYQLATCTDEGWILDTWPEKDDIVVSYWMPLPNPPKEVKQ